LDVTQYRATEAEHLRTADLLRLVPKVATTALDVGARDGHFSKLLADSGWAVTALDLDVPSISHPKVECVQGDITDLKFPDNSFDLVFCTEVLEHIPPQVLDRACAELSRVSSKVVLVGVPYRQDLRAGRTTCFTCGKPNPPWGHLSSFDEARLVGLFPRLTPREVSLVGKVGPGTNWLSAVLMDHAGNPYGNYDQDEPCIHCGSALKTPPERTPLQRVSTRIAYWMNSLQRPLFSPHANWIHMLFETAPQA